MSRVRKRPFAEVSSLSRGATGTTAIAPNPPACSNGATGWVGGMIPRLRVSFKTPTRSVSEGVGSFRVESCFAHARVKSEAAPNPDYSRGTTENPARPTAGTKEFRQKHWGQKNDIPIPVIAVFRHVSVPNLSVILVFFVFMSGAGFGFHIPEFFACRANSKR